MKKKIFNKILVKLSDISIIPKGLYCWSYIKDKSGKDKIYLCPFWSIKKSKPYQENGYCKYLKMGDWNSNYLSLLWDQVKECGINMDED